MKHFLLETLFRSPLLDRICWHDFFMRNSIIDRVQNLVPRSGCRG